MTAIVIPSVGAAELRSCLKAVEELDPPPARVVVVLSGTEDRDLAAGSAEVISSSRRLGFAAAVNRGLASVLEQHRRVALLNDDALAEPRWLAAAEAALDHDAEAAAVQGTVLDGEGRMVDGRGIAFDRWALPIQVDRGRSAAEEPEHARNLLAVSATAALFRSRALRGVALAGGDVLDESFGSYHEDLDLGLRLRRLGWRALWTPGARCRHLGSATGARLRWRHPWWLLANRWRALAGNLRPSAMAAATPRLLRGELRAIRSLQRHNKRSAIVAAAVLAAMPLLVLRAMLRHSAGPRLAQIPESTP